MKEMRFAYKLITGSPSHTTGSKRQLRCLSLDEFLKVVRSKQLVFFGEYHSEPRIIQLQQLVQGAMASEVKVLNSSSRESNVQSPKRASVSLLS
mmetsp:Transcript_9567/g.11913  ORF Transcript_9567/g.11913 Transcript_9567/m.11913 type:complete len:94 (+) Transcript_9567:304-585(+)